jgi:hypothetical protein
MSQRWRADKNTEEARGLVAAGGMRLYPLAGHPLGFGYLLASHPLFEDLFATLRTLISLGRRQKIHPHIGKQQVFRYA